MASLKQIAANRRNAQRSTGPRTRDGKARTSQNAVTHGLTARQIVIAAEDEQEFAAFAAALRTELDPQTPAEQLLFDQLVATAWRLQRVHYLEALCYQGHSEACYPVQLSTLGRHEARLERSLHRALRELT